MRVTSERILHTLLQLSYLVSTVSSDHVTHKNINRINITHKSSFMEKNPPNRLRNIENHIIFKNQLNAILVCKEYYSVKHFFNHKISENDYAFYTKIVK
jgi:hypothetical protein